MIPVPEGLEPENIPKGMSIAGILGLREAGANIKMAKGSFKGSKSPVTVAHGLGVVPDLFMFSLSTGPSNTTDTWIAFAIVTSKAFFSTGLWPFARGVSYTKAAGIMSYNSSSIYYSIDDTNSYALVSNANEETLIVGTGSAPNVTYSGTYNWFAIGGLT
jgi:hypothetical protein